MGDLQDLAAAQQTAADEVLAEYLQRVDQGEEVDREAFIAAHPEAADALKSYFAGADVIDRVAGPVIGETTTGALVGNDTAVATASQPDATAAQGTIPREFGRYRVISTLGHGAMGAVYLAEDTQLDRQVALKVPKFAESERDELLLRFDREAKAAATLSHPNVCPVFDVGEIDGIHFISMGYIEGRPLSDFINPRKPQPERLVAAIIRKLALAMDEAHQRGIVHRDIKPANIMIDQRSEPIIMDFGLARSIASSDKERVTHDGTIVGTPAYMPPEQVKGETDLIGPAADIYSLGVVMYELLTGRLPFKGSVTEVIARILRDPTPRATATRKSLDSRIDDLCFKMMSQEIADRFSSMSAVADALAEFLDASKSTNSKGAAPKRQATVAATPDVPLKPDSDDSPAKSSGAFDPYHKWLGIPPKEQPPNHYRLLAIELFETDLDVIEAAAVARSTYVRQCATGPHANVSQQVLNNLSEAEICLLNPEQKAAYDAQLRSELDAEARQNAVAQETAGSSEVASSETVSTGEKAKRPVDPKLAQLIDKLDKQKEQIESLLDRCEFAAAISALEKMAAVKNPKVAKYARWAKQQLPKARRGTQNMRESSAAMLRTAADLFERNDYEEAAEILQQIPQKYRDAEIRDLLQECLDIQEEVVVLQDDIDRAESLNKYDDLQPTVERLLELKPKDRRARRLIKELKAYGKGGRMRLGSRDGRFDAAGNTSNPLKVTLAILIPLVLFGIVGYATVIYIRSNNKTIQIEIDDPTAKVIIDGETVEISGVGDTIKLKVGKHDLVVERDDLVVHTRQFEVVKGKNRILQITLLGADGNPLDPTVADGGGADTLADALPITIVAKEERGYPIGAVKSGTELQIQYVSGKWKGWGSRADISPDNTTGRGGDACFLAIVDFPQGAASTAKVLQFVPEGTAQKPFTYVLQQDAENLVLRINDRGDGWAGNPGSVQYKVLVGGRSLGGAPPASTEPRNIAGLVAHYSLDETSGTIARDASGNGHDGTIRGNAEFTSGKVGGAMRFGKDALVDLGTPIDLTRSTPFSIGAWILPNETGRMSIVCRHPATRALPGYGLVLAREGTLYGRLSHEWGKNAIQVAARQQLDLKSWHHVMMTYDGSSKAAGLNLYVDGKKQEVNILQDTLTDSIATDSPITISQNIPDPPAKIDEVCIYNRVLSAAEVQTAMSPPGGATTPSTPPGTINFTQLTPAEAEQTVDVVGTKPVPLVLGTPDGKGWHDIPGFLRGACIFNDRQKGQARAGFADFTAKKATDVYLACSWAYEGNRSGGWFEQRVTDQQLQQQGWEKVGHMYASVHTRYRIFKRRLSQGEKFEIRTNKYSYPLVIVASADPGPSTTAVRLAPDPGTSILVPGKKATPLKDIQGVSGIPPMLQDATAYTGGAATYFTLGADQTVYIAASWAEAANRQGQWVEDQWKADKFQAEGWKDVGKIMFSAGKDEHTLFSRDCKKGETFWIRTRKRAGPILILNTAAMNAGTPATAASAPPDVSKLPVVCQLLQSKRAPQRLSPQTVKFAAPNGDGRRGANGFLIDAPAGWETNGTIWSCDFARDGASRGLIFIHPHKDGQVMVAVFAGGVHIGSPGDWPNDRNASLYIPRYKGFTQQQSPDFKQAIQLGDQSRQLISKLAADGTYQLFIDGKIVTTARISSPSLLKFKPEVSVAKSPASGTGGAIIGPTDRGSARASNLRFGAVGSAAPAG